MKKLTTFWFITTALVCMFSDCSKAQETIPNKDESLTDKNVLIVYLSRTKNTKIVAEIIHKNMGNAITATNEKFFEAIQFRRKNNYTIQY